ncbi:hypothetical protein Zm00014a_018374 [Zea mays]|jgi:hypothetical protein|uniref:Uncharacterized protein n=1 Tax=Zea mays TaxID=4577 RepID=A0A3L6DRP1_MAIZE|nr:hypothetical protein Zm00014a_018374 [Zea mays]
MSESGGTPPERQCPHQHQGPQKAQRRWQHVILCLAFTVLILLLAAAAAIALLAVLRPRGLVTELLSITATGVLLSVISLPTVSVCLNATFRLAIRIRNLNLATFHHGAAATSLYYRSAAMGYDEVPARGVATVRMDVMVQVDRVMAAAGVGARGPRRRRAHR